MRKAVFLDRDGVLNELVLNPETIEYEPPHSPENLVIFPWVTESLLSIQNAGFELFLVSNQPDYAKGKTSLETIYAVHTKFDQFLQSKGIHFHEYYYCYHHPNGIIPAFSCTCKCRKPKPYFIIKAASEYHLDLRKSWMIGDRDSDIECGKSAGTSTILIEEPRSSKSRGSSDPDYKSANLKDAVEIILHH